MTAEVGANGRIRQAEAHCGIAKSHPERFQPNCHRYLARAGGVASRLSAACAAIVHFDRKV